MDDAVSAYDYKMAQARISQLELENKMLKDRLELYERKHGTSPAAAPPAVQQAEDDDMAIDHAGGGALHDMLSKVMAERQEASAKFLTLMSDYQKRLAASPEPVDEHLSTEESFSLPSALNTQDSMAYLDSTTSTPLSTE